MNNNTYERRKNGNELFENTSVIDNDYGVNKEIDNNSNFYIME